MKYFARISPETTPEVTIKIHRISCKIFIADDPYEFTFTYISTTGPKKKTLS